MGGTLLVDLINGENEDEPWTRWNDATTVIAMTLVFGITTSLFIFMRLWTRYFIIRSVGWDDHLVMLILFTGGIGVVVMCLMPGVGGMGRHMSDLSESTKAAWFKLYYVGDASFVMSTALIKMSLLLQYLRIFQSGPVRLMCQLTMAAAGLWGFTMTFAAWFPCFPIHAFWEPHSPGDGSTCYGYGSPYADNYYRTFLSHSIINMVFDVVILLIPMPLLFREGTVRRTRMGLSGLLMVGALTNTMAVWRLIETVQHRAMSWPTYDPTWYAPKLCLLCMLEVNLACVGACVPVFWPVIRDRFTTVFVTHEINISVADRNLDDLPLQMQRSESLYSHAGDETGSGSISSKRLWAGDEDEDDEGGRGHRGRGGDSAGGGGGRRHRTTSSGDQDNGRRGGGGARRTEGSRGGGSRSGHYKDSYVMDQVDPLRKKTTLAVESVITADSNHKPSGLPPPGTAPGSGNRSSRSGGGTKEGSSLLETVRRL